MSRSRTSAPFRLSRLQAVNWGTFDGAFSLTVPERGLLITGPSGSGKSSLLDAMAAVLVQPRWLTFNAAAQEGSASDRSRSLVSYLRGAHRREVNELTGEIVTTYLRPGATWSAIGLTYRQGATVVQLIRLMHVRRSASSASEVTSAFWIADTDADLADLRPFAVDGLDVRRLKAAQPTWHYAATYSAFASRFRRRLGLASEQAQRLLHKTQSAKNLDSLDTLLRDFMLDEPGTFDQAAEAVEQFSELRVAHATVVDARKQVQTLEPLRKLAEDHAGAAGQVAACTTQLAHLDTWRLGAAREACVRKRDERLAERDRIAPLLGRADQEAETLRTRAADLQRRLDGLGGSELTALEGQLRLQRERVEDRRRARAERQRQAVAAGLALPDDERSSARFAAETESLLAETRRELAATREATHQLTAAKFAATDETRRLTEELRVLTTKQSNLDPHLLAAREFITSRLGMPEKDLPLVGELLQVRSDERRWTGAIERVLRAFARTLLVPAGSYAAVAELVNQHNLRTRLVYERIPETVPAPPEPRPGSLPDKVELADSVYAGWLAGQLARRFDYDCVDTVADLVARERAVTRQGQVKHSTTRHEKDDRSRIDDPRGWVLGFSVAAKQARLEELLTTAERTRAEAEHALETHEQHVQGFRDRVTALERLASLTWSEIDVARAEEDEASVRERIELIRARHDEFTAVERALAESVSEARSVEKQCAEFAARLDALAREAADLENETAALTARIAALPSIPEEVAAALTDRFTRVTPGEHEKALVVERGLREELAKAQSEAQNRAHRIERRMADYQRGWPAQSADLFPRMDFLDDFLSLLETLEADRLPDFEDRFFTLLQNQSRNNIGALALEINRSRGEIRARIDPINASLRRTEYAPARYLQVKVEDRKLAVVAEFLATLRDITSGSVDVLGADEADAAQSRARAEERFAAMEQLLHRLGSEDPAEIRWRRLCLDTRAHVQFSAVVQDADGHPVDYFTGAGGLSGGERQKLVTFCLAAALRYQLAPDGTEWPTYALVALDEAFDKTDPEFTRAGLEVFTSFGFQLLLATPLKMLQTLEDYVGGAVLVLNTDGRSRLEVLTFDRSPTAQTALADSIGGNGQGELW
ncbi:MAG TPA: hypothetical protein GXZ30_07360 [Propionibacterium sp.]|nr:hypothetical protein [Propionibacterium sp.]